MSNEVLKKAVDLLSDELSEYVEAERLRGMLRSVGMSESDIAELGWGEKEGAPDSYIQRSQRYDMTSKPRSSYHAPLESSRDFTN